MKTKSEKQKRIPTIYTQAAIAMMLIQFLHKVVHEMQFAPKVAEILDRPVYYGTVAFTIGYLLAIPLSLIGNRWGFILGMILGIEMIIQPILMHVILAIPKDPIYYPIFSFTQGIFLTYFSYLAWKNRV